MAIGKVRTNKRSSSTSSHSSTLTTLVLGGLCVFGIWMLSSNTIFSPGATSRIATSTTSSAQSSSSLSNSDQENQQPTKPIAKKSQHVFEDSQGDLPEDAIKPEHETVHSHLKGESSDAARDDSSSTDATSDQVDATVDKQDSELETNNASSQNSSDHEESKEENPAVEENPHEMKGQESEEEKEKQKNLETQNSEESSLTQNQEAEETEKGHANEESQQKGDNTQDGGNNHHEERHNDEQPENKEHELSDEDQRKRLEQQQQKEDEQIEKGKREGETSHDQTEHNEARPETETDNKIGQTTENGNVSVGEADKKEKSSKSFPSGENSAIPKESKESKKSWSTQADESENQKERGKVGTDDQDGSMYGYTWQLCNTTAGSDYIPCLDNEKEITKLHSRKHYEHRERHCPGEAPTCLVPVPEGYKKSIEWPQSRDKIWYHNVPHTKLAEVKGHQNWVKVTGEFLTFPGGGTQFIHGALHYIDFLQEAIPDIAWGKHSRVLLDVGCGVASFGGFLFERDVLAMSFAPKDEHEAQVQFALERGIPAISAVMGSQRLPFPSRVFDVVHCARCRVPWHVEGGTLLLELNRVLRPGGYFVWSATPVYQTLEEDVQIWKEMSNLTVSMCWELVMIKKDKLNSIGAAIYRKPDSNECYDKRMHNHPPMCKNDDDPNAAWYVPLQACMHRVPTQANERGSEWPEEWPRRLQATPYWLNRSQLGVYGKPAPDDFVSDYEHWKRVVNKSYLSGLGISWSDVRNIMDMRAVYGGFAGALKDLKVWVMNVVNVDSPDTLPLIFERGLFGIYHDWCESFSTYPRTYDLLHADHLFSKLKKRCKLAPVLAEVDRIVRPGGKFIVRDDSGIVGEVENLLKSLHWEIHMTFSQHKEGILSAQKSMWRPDSYAAAS